MFKNKKILIITSSFIALALIGGIGLFLNSRQTGPENDSPSDLGESVSIGPNTKGEKDATSSVGEPPSSASSNKDKSGNPSSSTTSGNTDLKKPTGNFVSSHKVTLTTLVASSCVTSSGATCTIAFTMGNTTRSLEKRTTDLEGASYWEWKPSDIGLTPGTWKIKAIASNGANDKITEDLRDLEVTR